MNLKPPECRSPRGERGLKHISVMANPWAVASLPPRGAWIETIATYGLKELTYVAPPAGSVD